MMHRCQLLILVICILVACKSRPREIPDPNVQAVISVCIRQTIGNADSARYYYKLLPLLNEDQYSKSVKKYNDSLRVLLDTAIVYLFVKDSLDHISSGDREDLENFLKKYLADIDSSRLLVRPDYLSLSPQILNLDLLEKTIHIPVKSKEEGINDGIRLIGRFIFSNVIFNKKKTKAVVLLDYLINHRGYGEIFLLNKEKDSWKVMKRERTWVS